MPSITTSYFGKVKNLEGVIVPIVRYLPASLKSIKVLTYFAPSRMLLNAYKKDNLSWKQYAERYKKEQQKHLKESPEHFQELLEKAAKKDIILCCYEKYKGKKTECHRLVLYDFLKKIAKKHQIKINFIDES